jgi:type VI secretion system protein ImpE
MTPTELYKAGQLGEAVTAQLQEVKSHPADHGKRLFLFELLSFAGDLDRARKQIDIVQYGEAERDAAVLAYRKLLDAETKRRALFSDGLKPQFLAPPPEHVNLRLDAVNRLREKKPAEAAEALAKAHEKAPPLKGKLNGKDFTELRDCDDLFSGILEVMSQGNYYWLPLEQIDSLAVSAAKYPRDLLWASGFLQVIDGPAGDVFLPTLYPGSHEHADNQVKLGRMTDWKSTADGPVLGVGLRLFLVDDADMSLLEWRELEMETGT